MSQPRDDRQDDLFQPSLEQIISCRHALVLLAGEVDWDFVGRRFSSVCRVGPGQPPLSTRLVAGLFIIKHMHNLSDEELCARWVENPYYQYFCGEVVFRHALPFDRSSLTRWRQRLGEEQLAALLQESLSVAHWTGAIETKDLERVVVDTTVQEKAIAHPTDARLTHRAIEKLVALSKREGVELRQSYRRVAKRAAIMVGRYTHAHQFKRARRELKFLRTRLGRIIRDIRRKIAGNPALEIALARCSISRCVCAIRSSASAGRRSIRCMRPRSNASAKARPANPMSSAARSRSRRRSPRPRAGSSCCMPRRCTATPTTAIRLVPS
jgi:IS5 family transposase